MIAAFFLSSALVLGAKPSSPQQADNSPKQVTLQRVFTVGTKSHYKVHASIENEISAPAQGLLTFIPQETILFYDYYTRVTKVEAGTATLRYFRPEVFETDDNGGEEGPTTIKVPLNATMDLTLSPINAILDEKEISSIKKPKPVKVPNPYGIISPHLQQVVSPQSIFGGLFQQLNQIAALIGGPGSGIDLKPELSLVPVSIGSTWKKTVGYEPQVLGGGSKKTAIKRLDITYTYKGPAQYKGKSFLEIDGEIHLNTDLQDYFKDQFHATAEQTHLKSLPMNLDETLKFYLDPKTLQTVYGIVESTGGISLMTTQSDQAYLEIKIKGSNQLELVSTKQVG